MMTFPLRLRTALTALALLCAGAAAHAAALTVAPASPRAGLIFTDSERVDVRAKVTGAAGPTVVQYKLTETEGDLVLQGEVSIQEPADGTGEAPLPLDINGRRGLYTLNLTAVCGDAKAEATTTVAVVFTPDPPNVDSPWGIFYIPQVGEGEDGLRKSADDLALSHRLLGASWTRFNFWAGTFGKVTVTPGDPAQVTADWHQARVQIDALRRHGVFIMGEIAQCPRELSSRPNDEESVGDAGPVYNRVKPADYALWDQLMTKLAADFKDEIKVWEIWNEVNWPNGYWTGTVEDLAVHIHHTAAAFRKGNPETRVAAAGFVGGQDFADQLFTLGMGKDIDILSVHYTDDTPSWIPEWEALLKKHNLSLPIWNTEERSEIPLHNLASPIERSFKFCHLNIGYEHFRPLVNLDLTARPPAIAFSVGAHCIGMAKGTSVSDEVPGFTTHYLQRGDEKIAVFVEGGRAIRLFRTGAVVELELEPLTPGQPLTLTDVLGRSTEVPITDGKARVEITRTVILNGARTVKVLGATAMEGKTTDTTVVEAETGKLGPGWFAADHDSFSEGRTVDIWNAEEPGPDGYWVELPFSVPAAGSYEVLFSGNGLSRLAAPRSLSTFQWQIDGGEAHQVDGPMPTAEGVFGAPEGLATLGKIDLTAGEHTFRLKLTGRRETPDTNYALWFDALALRRL